MSKKKKIVIVIGIISSIIVAFIGGQSFSKYVSEIKGYGNAEIATWSFKVNGGTQEIQTIKLVSTYNNETLTQNKVAPGTQGSFDIVVDGSGSDVGIDYYIKFANETTKPNNLKFIYNNQKYDNISQLENLLSGTINTQDENKIKTYTIKWEWLYETGNDDAEIENNDIVDTQNAKDIINYSFDVAVSGTQVIPQN